MRRTARIFGRRSAIASTWLGESLRPAGGVFDGATGIGASGFVEDVDFEEDDDWCALLVVCASALDAIGAGCGALASEPGAACAAAGSAQLKAHAIGRSERRTTRA